MSKNLSPIFDQLTGEVLLQLQGHYAEIKENAEKYGILTSDMWKDMLELRGSLDEKVTKFWKFVTARMTEDWSHYWRFILVLMKSGMEETSEKLLPTHFKKGADTVVLTDANLEEETKGAQVLLARQEHHWVTGSRQVKKLMKSLMSTTEQAQKEKVLEEYINKNLPLQSIHPGDESSEQEPIQKPSRWPRNRKRASAPTTPPSVPSTPLTPSSDPSHTKGHHTVIIVSILVSVAVVILLIIAIGVVWTTQSSTGKRTLSKFYPNRRNIAPSSFPETTEISMPMEVPEFK